MYNYERLIKTLELQENRYVLWRFLYHRDESKYIVYILSEKKGKQLCSMTARNTKEEKVRNFFRYLARAPLYCKNEEKIYNNYTMKSFLDADCKCEVLKLKNCTVNEVKDKGMDFFEMLEMVSEYALLEKGKL